MEKLFSTYTPDKPDAYANLIGGPLAPNLEGDIFLYQLENGVYIRAFIKGIPPSTASNFYGFHIHQTGDCAIGDSTNPFVAAGDHFNPTDEAHPSHEGDLPPILSAHGIGILSVYTDRFMLNDVIGKSFILHEKPDDFTTQPSGNSGARLACGIIVPYK